MAWSFCSLSQESKLATFLPKAATSIISGAVPPRCIIFSLQRKNPSLAIFSERAAAWTLFAKTSLKLSLLDLLNAQYDSAAAAFVYTLRFARCSRVKLDFQFGPKNAARSNANSLPGALFRFLRSRRCWNSKHKRHRFWDYELMKWARKDSSSLIVWLHFSARVFKVCWVQICEQETSLQWEKNMKSIRLDDVYVFTGNEQCFSRDFTTTKTISKPILSTIIIQILKNSPQWLLSLTAKK